MNVATGILLLVCFVTPAFGQGKRLWVLRAPGEMVEYDPATFAARQTVKVPSEAMKAPQNLLVNHLGQMLFASSVALPLGEDEPVSARKVWFWDGRTASTLVRDVTGTTTTAGSNLAVEETASVPVLSDDGTHLYWFANQARRLQRDGVDLSTKTTWQAWRTDLAGAAREEIASTASPDCRCTTGACEETCPYGETWIPDGGAGKFFLLTQFVAGQIQPIYQASFLYQESAGKWAAVPIDPPLRRILDAADSNTLLEAIPDAGCCGWENQSNDQTLLRTHGKTLTLFDERAAFQNPDYDVSFYTENAKLSPDLASLAMTIAATSEPNQPIQLADDGQANPEESQRIRKSLAEMPAVEVKSVEDSPRRIAYIPHANLVGCISEKEILIVEGHLLVAYNVASGTRRKSNIRVEGPAWAFLR